MKTKVSNPKALLMFCYQIIIFQLISMSAYQTRVILMQIVQIQLEALPVNVEMGLMVMGGLVQV